MQRVAHGLEEGRVVVDADVFEHAHRDDAIDRRSPVAVVQQLEANAVLQALTRGTFPCDLELLHRKCQPCHLRVVLARQVQRHPAPAAPDVQHVQAVAVQLQLGRDVSLLEGLGF